MSDARFYIGFPTLEEFLKQLPATDIYYSATTKTTTGQYGTQRKEWLVRIASIFNEKCFYWQFKTGSSQSIGGHPMGDAEENSRRRTFDFLDLLKDLLESSTIVTKNIEAMVSFPSDLEVLYGQTNLFIYDAETDGFRRNDNKQ